MIVHSIIFVLALAGLGVSSYLLAQRRKSRPPVCVIGDSCDVVWESPKSKIFGVGNEVYGIVFYTTVAVVELALILGVTDELLAVGEKVLLAGGFVMSCYYTYLQCSVIRAWCFWCTLSAVIVFAMVLVRVLL